MPFGVAFDAQRLEENLRAAEYALEAAAAAWERRRERARAMARGEDVDDGFGRSDFVSAQNFVDLISGLGP